MPNKGSSTLGRLTQIKSQLSNSYIYTDPEDCVRQNIHQMHMDMQFLLDLADLQYDLIIKMAKRLTEAGK